MSVRYTVRTIAGVTEAERSGLSDVLIDCVEGGASVGFLLPMTRPKADAFWNRVAQGVAGGERVLIVAEDPNREIVGTIMLVWAEPENQPHRADVAKMLVHRRVRRQGIAAALLAAAEQAAIAAGRSLLVLDTVTGGDADRLYGRHGWQRSGEIPHYALWPDGGLCATRIYYKWLAP